MRNVLFSLVLLILGAAAGYLWRGATSEARVQRNLSSLSGETLSHLDALGRFTRGFSAEDIDRRWKEYIAAGVAANDIDALHEAWDAWQNAVIFGEVEKVGWKKHRGVIVFHCAKYLKTKPQLKAPASAYVEKESQRALDAIREAIPEEMLAKETVFD